jgi:hypothetical protein
MRITMQLQSRHIADAQIFVNNLKRDGRNLPDAGSIGGVARFYGVPECLWRLWRLKVTELFSA